MKVEIMLTNEQIKQILAQDEKKAQEKKNHGRFYPKEGEEYFRMGMSGMVISVVSRPNRDYDDIFMGNCFRTEKEAREKGKKNIERIKAINRVNQYIDENGLREEYLEKAHKILENCKEDLELIFNS